MPITLLDEFSVGPLLRKRGVIDGPIAVSTLSGGVSNVVLAVESSRRSVVVKQSLERLRVAAEWHAPQRRILAEAEALRLAERIQPRSVPAVIDVDPDNMVLVLEMAPEGAVDWKQLLMRGEVDADFARQVGTVVGRLHSRTESVSLPPQLTDHPDAFEALRLDPYLEATAHALPMLAPQIRATAERIRHASICLVHGDLSPKNILALPGREPWPWLIDFEVAQRGDPTFDVAFLLTHLMLKSVRTGAHASALDTAADAFLAGYAGFRPPPGASDLLPQMGCLLLARVVGKSPVEYLSRDTQATVLRMGELALRGGLDSLHALRDWRERA